MISQYFLSSLPNPLKSQYTVTVGKSSPFWKLTSSICFVLSFSLDMKLSNISLEVRAIS